MAWHKVAPTRIFESGAILDADRFRTLQNQLLGVDIQVVHIHKVDKYGDLQERSNRWFLWLVCLYLRFTANKDSGLVFLLIRNLYKPLMMD